MVLKCLVSLAPVFHGSGNKPPYFPISLYLFVPSTVLFQFNPLFMFCNLSLNTSWGETEVGGSELIDLLPDSAVASWGFAFVGFSRKRSTSHGQ